MDWKLSFGRIAGVLLIGLALPSSAATIYVNSPDDIDQGTCPGQTCTIRQAVITAAAGDTIAFALPPNTIVSINQGALLVNKALTIRGPGAKSLTLRRNGGGSYAVLNTSGAGGIKISGLTISGGGGAPVVSN